MQGLGWIAAIIVGGFAGWFAAGIMGANTGLVMNIVLGIVGAIVGNFLLGLAGMRTTAGSWLSQGLAGLLGAVFLIWVVRGLG